MGQAWDEAAVAEVKTAIQGVGLPRGASPVVMRNDTSIPTPPPPAPEYAVQLLRRMRETLGKLLAGEKLDGPEEGVIVCSLCLSPIPSLFVLRFEFGCGQSILIRDLQWY